jgi:hypothetical protein
VPHYFGCRPSSLSADTYGNWQLASECKREPGCFLLVGYLAPVGERLALAFRIQQMGPICYHHRLTVKCVYYWCHCSDTAPHSPSRKLQVTSELRTPTTPALWPSCSCWWCREIGTPSGTRSQWTCNSHCRERLVLLWARRFGAASIFALYPYDGGNRLVETAITTRLHGVPNYLYSPPSEPQHITLYMRIQFVTTSDRNEICIFCNWNLVVKSMTSIHDINTLIAELNPICHLLELLGAHHILHVSWIRVKGPFL